MTRKGIIFAMFFSFSGVVLSQSVFYEGIEFPGGVDSFADDWESFDPVFVSPNEPEPSTQYPASAIGAPNYFGLDCKNSICPFATLGDGGSITVRFDNNYLTGSNTPTDDLWIFEVGPDIENCDVEISRDGNIWYSVGSIGGSTSGVDIDQYGHGQNDQFSFVRITDDTYLDEQSGDTVGADIDAVGAISSSPIAICDLNIGIIRTTQQGSGECEAIASITFEYAATAEGCDASSNIQLDDDVPSTCSNRSYNLLNDSEPAYIMAWSVGEASRTYYNAIPDPVDPFESFVVSANSGVIGPRTIVKPYNEGGAAREYNEINTECTTSLEVGDIYGSLKVLAIEGAGVPGTGEGQPTVDITTYEYTVTNNGDPVTNVSINDSVFGEVGPLVEPPPPIYPFPLLGTSEIVTYIVQSEEYYSDNIGKVTAMLGNFACTGDTAPQSHDYDQDGVMDDDDNCPITANTGQFDTDGNGVGDACEPPDNVMPPSPPPPPVVEEAACAYNVNAGYDNLLLLLLAAAIFYGRAVLYHRKRIMH